MAVATYGSEGAGALSSTRGTALQRPFQIVIIAADLLLILLSYGAGRRSTMLRLPPLATARRWGQD